MDEITNVLAQRYATAPMKEIWSPAGRIRLEREFWIAVLKAQKDLGLSVDEGAIEAYEAVVDQIDLTSIMERERITRHDVKARIEEFCDLAGFELIHRGMTSRDLTENVEQLQVARALQLIKTKSLAVLHRMARLAEQYQDLVITGRTHNVAAQPTTLGKRIAMFGEDLLSAYDRLEHLTAGYPVRGLKGAVGTQLDPLTLFSGDAEKVQALEAAVVKHLGFTRALGATGQVYPRSLDFEVVSALCQLAAGPGSFCKTLRVMAGHETASEGFAKGQVGSSAMPHKMNSRSCERVNGFQVILGGYLTMTQQLAGDQWNEGDVSCSVVRRVALPDSFYTIDGLLETFITILDQMEIFEAMIKKENDHYFPFLSTTTFLMEAVKKGAGRETAHEAIKEHAVAVVRQLRNGEIDTNDLVSRLAKDDRLGLTESEMNAVLDQAQTLTGGAVAQTKEFCRRVDTLTETVPEARTYEPGAIL